ncbi:metallophosphoesterase [Microtetraspora sp. NBRC 16547]|uniref:metallophosphoesterase n=1 Tax=Microtetraspora sp. NBRC 16547 TaxID=3030993 RepID=UPI0024A5A2FF|nr:metallophosphoesterase [Microtetraspora sp. NBRC 16547]GLX01434.1 membrane protein [Microtetraspora sp. NBRC 16547]
MGFLITILAVVVVVHYYLWRRLVRPTTRPGSVPRRVLTWGLVLLVFLLPLRTIGGQVFGMSFERVIAWPGYMWLAIMFYLVVFTVALEIPRAIALLMARRPENSPGPVESREPVDSGRPVDSAGFAGPAGSPGSVDSGDPVLGSPFAPGPSTGSGTSRASAISTDPVAVAGSAESADLVASTAPAISAGPGTSQVDRRVFIARTAATVAGVGALATVGYGMRTAMGDPVIERIPVRLPRLDPRMSGLRFAVVSDIHIGPLTGKGHTERIVRMINSLQADVVTIVGDLVDGSVAELGPLAAPLRNLESRYGAYFVTGNHEYYTSNGPQEWIEELNSLGVRSLRNERVEIAHAGAVLDLAGINDLYGTPIGDGPDLEKALGGRDAARPVVLLAHQPVQVRQAAGYGVDLQLSGHTHGGQMAPFNLAVPLQQPVVAGLDKVDGTQIYVTRGAGYWGPPVRVGAPPEITLIELRS